MAVCAVMGHLVDLLDTDPRNGGDATRQGIIDAGSWPTIYWEAATPSDGSHEFVTSLGVRSLDNLGPGLDFKAGIDGGGHGFAFIAPTVRASKTTGELEPYRWIVEPLAMIDMTGDDSGQAIAELVTQRHGNTPQRNSDSTRRGAPRVPTQLVALPDEELCEAMQKQTNLVAKALANGKRHKATLAPVMQLVRLEREGHRGLVKALAELSEDFISRVSPDRGAAEAKQEWNRSVAGAFEEVLGEHGQFPDHPACDCLLRSLRTASKDPALFSSGTAGLTERRVMGYLIDAATLGRAVMVAESQRQIAEAIDHRQATVSNALRRLAKLGWLELQDNEDPLAPKPILLLHQLCKDVSTKAPVLQGGLLSTAVLPSPFTAGPLAAGPTTPPTAGPLVDTNLHTQVHRLFGSQGLRAGPSETFALLPENRVRLIRGYLTQVVKGTLPSPLLVNPWQGTRQIPPDPGNDGHTVQELAEATGKNRSTVARHLKLLHDRGMAFSVTEPGQPPRWWRYRFDPDWVAEIDQIPHTGDIKAARHARERIANWERLSRPESGRVRIEVVDGERLYIDHATGAVLGSRPEDPRADEGSWAP